MGTLVKETNPYLLAIMVTLFSDLEISKSENNTLLAQKIKTIKITKRLIFFMAIWFNRFDTSNFENIFLTAKDFNVKSLKNAITKHFVDYFN